MYPDLRVPSQISYAGRESLQHVQSYAIAIHGVSVSLKEIHAHASNAGFVPLVQGGVAGVWGGDDDAAQPLGILTKRLEDRSVVLATRAAGHQYTTGQAKPLQMLNERFRRKLLWCVAAIFCKWKGIIGAEDMRVRVACACWRRKSRSFDAG